MSILELKSVFQQFAVKTCRLGVLILSLFFLNVHAVSPLDINSATVEQFAAVLSGVGEAKAKSIVAFRDQNGRFETVEELIKVKGIGRALLNKNRTFITVNDEQNTVINTGNQPTDS
ncbi:ComEA family DNA-binding protein [Marinomonas sp. 2405UD68-3]|uniref:ComEA family DNA-binding protein n=1 Tax=Marinomonas sp. 2405UD68-3 TaxID=3391835 RepID=UPI0039C8E511